MKTSSLLRNLTALVLSAAGLAAAELQPVTESPVMQAKDKERIVELRGLLNGSKELYLLVSDLGANACDWANWIEPVVALKDGTKVDLTKLKWKEVDSFGQTRVGRNHDGKPLVVAGKTYQVGIGTHANSFIAFELPGPGDVFVSKVAIDDGGAIRGGKPSSADVKFAVFTQRPSKYMPVDFDSGPLAVPAELFTLPEGLEVTVWATSPMIFNPTNIDFDEKGRMYVAEGVNYRSKAGRRPEGDRIVILEDTTGAGRADKVSVFTQETALVSPLGVAHIDGKVVVSQPPDLLVYTDVDGDGKIDLAKGDRREVLLTGFNGRNHDHSLHSVTFGPDGRWNFNQGNTCAQFTDRSGKTFRIGSPYNHGEWTKQAVDAQAVAGLRSDDGNVWVGGFSVRMNSDGTEARIMGHNYRNSFEQSVNSFGDMYQSDNDDPPACRVSLVMEGGNAGFASADGKRSWGADRRPGQETPVAEWRQDDPGTMPAGDVYGGGSPTGVAFYENGALGDRWNGLLLACEAGKNVVFGYLPKPDGAGMKLERFDFFTSNKDKEWAGSDFLGGKATGVLKTRFRPSDVCVGPDGAIYVADWFDPGVGGHATRDNALAGTIYRIAPKGFKSVVPKIDLATTEGQIAALRSPSPNLRAGGFNRLRASGDKAFDAVATLLADANPFVSSRAVWLLAQLGERGVARVRQELGSSDDTRRLVAFRALRAAGRDVFPLCEKMSDDASPALRREVALALRDFRTPEAVRLLVKIARRFDGKDRSYLEAIGLAATDREAEVHAAIAKEMSGPVMEWSEAYAWLTWRLHPASTVRDVRARLVSGKLDEITLKRDLTTLAFTRSAEAVGTMVELSLSKDFPQRDLAKWWLGNRKASIWKDLDVDGVVKAHGGDASAAKLVAAELPPEPVGAKPLASVEAIAALKGDVERGRAAAAVCVACHKFEGKGVDYGPDLTTYAKQQSPESLILNIAQPSNNISHGFEGARVALDDGMVITGMVLSPGDPLIIKSMGGLVQSVPRARIKEEKPLGRSLMFSPAQMGLTEQSVADIAAYLRSL
ncbi:MAG: PVC-type heme-binding CxxCH protein [Verrucomicrobiota bacterium]